MPYKYYSRKDDKLKIYTLGDGSELVKAARASIELFIKNPHFNRSVIEESIQKFKDAHGVFVTLNYYQTNALRGCVGFPRPVSYLGRDIIDAALAAAFEDPRFVPVSLAELNKLIVEVSILSPPEELKKKGRARLRDIKIGRDGTIIQYGIYSGLLLPIVAVEQHWNPKTLLEETCVKTGLPKEYWLQPNVKIYRFETQVFKEEEPNGRVTEVKLESQ